MPRSVPNARASMRAHTFGPLEVLVPVIGQGTWQMHDRAAGAARAEAALRLGIELGMTHIDTAEMYGDGRAEEIVADAIEGIPRERLFIVSKVLPQNATYRGTLRACEQSLRRLRSDYLDVYLLHWPSSHPIGETMRAMEELVDAGKVRALGVSNFDVDEMEGARQALRRHPLACNQVLYHLRERAVEHAVLPYCREHRIAHVAYSPLGQGDFPSARSAQGQVLERVAGRLGATARQVALAFLTRSEGMFAIPKAEAPEHVRENAGAGDVRLSAADIAEIDKAFPLPRAGRPLPMN
jgi:diketogulonate reductase-like aldo/keto reductase